MLKVYKALLELIRTKKSLILCLQNCIYLEPKFLRRARRGFTGIKSKWIIPYRNIAEGLQGIIGTYELNSLFTKLYLSAQDDDDLIIGWWPHSHDVILSRFMWLAAIAGPSGRFELFAPAERTPSQLKRRPLGGGKWPNRVVQVVWWRCDYGPVCFLYLTLEWRLIPSAGGTFFHWNCWNFHRLSKGNEWEFHSQTQCHRWIIQPVISCPSTSQTCRFTRLPVARWHWTV